MIELQAIGHIGRDAEQKTISGNSYASFSLAITEKVRGEERTTWVRVLKMDKEGKLTTHLTKGSKVWVRGNPSFSAYTSKNTSEAIADITIWAEKLEFCSSGERKQGCAPEQKTELNNFRTQADDDDDLPF